MLDIPNGGTSFCVRRRHCQGLCTPCEPDLHTWCEVLVVTCGVVQAFHSVVAGVSGRDLQGSSDTPTTRDK